jgi:hypothetical protein
MANLLGNARTAKLPPEETYAFAHRYKLGRIIRESAIWGLAILAFLCGSASIVTLFGNKSQMTFLFERTAQLSSLISQKNTTDERVENLARIFSDFEHRQAETEAQLSQFHNVESTVRNLSQHVENIAKETATLRTSLSERIDGAKDKISLMELRLSKAEENIHAAVKPDNADDGRSFLAVQSPFSRQRRSPISNFSLVRISSGSAILACPQGWVRVETGTRLPGGAKILEIGRRNNRAFVLTDQGAITKAP